MGHDDTHPQSHTHETIELPLSDTRKLCIRRCGRACARVSMWVSDAHEPMQLCVGGDAGQLEGGKRATTHQVVP
jgi:hypothetical protein